MVGRAVRERLPDAIFLTRQDCNLEDASAVRRVFGSIRPTVVIHAAALVGGIKINAAKPYDFFTRNVTMNSNVTDAALAVGVDYLVAVSSACAYPKDVSYPVREEQLHLGEPAVENAGYALSKRSMSFQLDAASRQYGLRSVALLSSNLFGPHDRFDLQSGHFIPALILRVHDAKVRNKGHLDLLGTGRARRQFMYVRDLAEVIVRCLELKPVGDLNVAPPENLTIDEIAAAVQEALGSDAKRRYSGTLDGVMRRDLDTTRLQTVLPELRFTPFADAVRATYESFLIDRAAGVTRKEIVA